MNQLAKRVVELATHQTEEEDPAPPDAAAVKRGNARAASFGSLLEAVTRYATMAY